MLYLSSYLKAHRAEYYDRLMAVRLAGDWEGWIKFFLRGVPSRSKARRRRKPLARLCNSARTSGSGLRLGG